MEFIELLRQTAAQNDRLLRACQKINEGITELCTVLAETAPKAGPDRPLHQLTPRQKEVFGLLGTSAVEQIAKALDLSQRTVESHRDTIRRRLNFKTVAELIDFAKLHPKG